MPLPVEIEREDDGRWLAEIPDLPGVLAYGATPAEAVARAQALAAHGPWPIAWSTARRSRPARADLFAVPA